MREFGDKLINADKKFALFIIMILAVFGILILFAFEWAHSKAKKHAIKTKKITNGDTLVGRHMQNPVISPVPHNEWETQGTFNPAAWHDDNGNIHIVYRAVGSDGVSRLGYAKSRDGENFERLPYPVFVMDNPRQIRYRNDKLNATFKKYNEPAVEYFNNYFKRYDPVMYPSGGSYGGAEDPRMVEIDGRIYISCSAFDGWDFIRIAIFSIKKEDFINQRWNWSKTLLVSPEGELNKNWVLFPQKFNGKFAILHSLNPKIQIAYVDRLEDLAYGAEKVKSSFGSAPDREEWDTRIRGAGAPPVKTKYGWLVIYHATDKNEPHKYKVGAIILDIDNPEKIIARSPGPILTPDMWYENDGKPGVVYVCGAVLENGILYIYYGGGDKYICMAQVPEEDLLKWILGK